MHDAVFASAASDAFCPCQIPEVPHIRLPAELKADT
jgi:hypothetical protein